MNKQTESTNGIDLIGYAIDLAVQNVINANGGPFGAIIYNPQSREIVGIGANSVVPNCDPTAHAEVMAARDAIKKLGKKDLSGLHCYTSCECCPMCLAYLLDLGISKIYFAASRIDAATAHFSDEQQYDLINAGYDSNCSHTNEQIEPSQYEESETVDKLRELCKKTKSFHLPEELVFKCSHKPHPYSLIALDWARIGRVRDKNSPNDPNLDSIKKDVSKILYSSNEYEKMSGFRSVDEILKIIKNGDSSIISHLDHPEKLTPFQLWIEGINKQSFQKY